jgi:hypothetical protein
VRRISDGRRESAEMPPETALYRSSAARNTLADRSSIAHLYGQHEPSKQPVDDSYSPPIIPTSIQNPLDTENDPPDHVLLSSYPVHPRILIVPSHRRARRRSARCRIGIILEREDRRRGIFRIFDLVTWAKDGQKGDGIEDPLAPGARGSGHNQVHRSERMSSESCAWDVDG